MFSRKLPIGIQDFVSLRQDGYLYVDKTEHIYRLVNQGRSYFLSRPRRFGKSLLLSTIGAYLEGRRELFAGLALEKLEKDWTVHPVLRLDLNAEHYTSTSALEGILDSHLRRWEGVHGTSDETSLSRRFLAVIRQAREHSGQRVVVLIDEYDKPLLASLGQTELHAAFKGILKSFYGVLKSADPYLKFAILTGVTKFGQVSVFSDLNQLIDLTLHPAYATLCGLTEEELLATFQPELQALAESEGLGEQDCLEKIRYWYNGYHFHPAAIGVYNPFSTLNMLAQQEFVPFWFATGTPTFLVELLKSSDYDLRDLEGVELGQDEFVNYRADPDRPLPVIYQSGYLTIKGYDPRLRLYTLGYPNAEVRYSFLSFLLPSYSGTMQETTRSFAVAAFAREVESGQPEAFLKRLRAFFAGIPYELSDRTERHYQVIFYLVFTLLGQFIQAELRSAKGRADAVVSSAGIVYVFEFKLQGSAEEALRQIDHQGYLVPFSADGRRLFKIGVEFDPEERNLGRWLIVEA
jgi:hypothetical protein